MKTRRSIFGALATVLVSPVVAIAAKPGAGPKAHHMDSVRLLIDRDGQNVRMLIEIDGVTFGRIWPASWFSESGHGCVAFERDGDDWHSRSAPSDMPPPPRKV